MTFNFILINYKAASGRKDKKFDFEVLIVKLFIFIAFFLLFSILFGCKKLVSIPEPNNSITTAEAYSTDALATSTIAGIYTQMINSGSLGFGDGALTIYGGLSADELTDYRGTSDATGYAFQSNSLSPTNSVIGPDFWSQPYSYIYIANSAISSLPGSMGVHDSVKNELIGEAKFIRAFCYFYLTNLFGDVPLVLTTDWNQVASMGRTNQTTVYTQIVNDLAEAEQLLPADYSVAAGERIRPNKYTAAALLARVYLFQKKWDSAAMTASTIISNTTLYTLDTLGGVFLANSAEAIWQLKPNNEAAIGNAIPDGYYQLPTVQLSTLDSADRSFYLTNWTRYGRYTVPPYLLDSTLINAFEAGDGRLQKWVASTGVTPSGTFYYDYKYTIGPGQNFQGAPVSQYYMVLRLAEQYLIRAEAEANSNNLSEAVSDLNVIRERAGLPDTSNLASPTQVMDAIMQEKRVEFFCEWAHRWMDLKRWGVTAQVLVDKATGAPSNNALYFPIPNTDLSTDPNLSQNTGY